MMKGIFLGVFILMLISVSFGIPIGTVYTQSELDDLQTALDNYSFNQDLNAEEVVK